MPTLFDTKHVRRAFSRAASGYHAAAALQQEVAKRLLESLDYLDGRQPQVVLDVGSGPAHATAAMKKRWPKLAPAHHTVHPPTTQSCTMATRTSGMAATR